MKFGIMLDSAVPPDHHRGLQEVMPETLSLIQYAERLGFDGVWFAGHHFTAENYDPPPLIMSAFAAAVTNSIAIGTSIIILPLNHPLHVIESAALLDQTSHGRFILGVGLGYRAEEYSAFGIDRRTRGRRMEESIAIMKLYLSERKFDFHGDSYDLHGVEPTLLPAAPEDFPIWVGARGTRALERAGRFGCDLLFGSRHDPLDAYYRALRANGHDPGKRRLGAHRAFHVASTTEEAWERCGPSLLYQAQASQNWFGKAGDLERDHRPQHESVESLGKVIDFVGSAEKVADDIRRFQQRYSGESPLEWLILNPRPADLPLDLVRDSMLRFSAEVLPQFQAPGT
jgi:alkanesulfonate monooxygenase SsuD/methylene tetrahydromethanopterin reductase-like flavin-dependent oxidoreductase (luciferase family)